MRLIRSVGSALFRQLHTLRPSAAPKSMLTPRVLTQVQVCGLSLNHPHSRDEIEKRVMFVLHMYDKIDPSKLCLESNFHQDLGLDSLDHVDVVCAMEDEFVTEIPDQHAYELHSPERIVRYLCDKFDIYDDIRDLSDDKPDVELGRSD